MSLPAWVRFGVKCVCIEDAWVDVGTDDPSEGAVPVKGQIYTITLAQDLGYAGFVVLAEFSAEPDLWNIEAFRPLTRLEADTIMFAEILKGAAATAAREMEPAS